MAKFWLSAAVGLYLLQLCLAQISLNVSCRYAGVFHVEKNRRYSLTREEAIQLCKALNSTLPTWEQMEKAFDAGLETCRYGYIEEKIVVPRHNPYHLCAANTTGIYVLQSNVSDRYDTYCFNSSETREKVCDPVTELYSSWPDDQSIIDISNADGTRYIGGKQYTEQPPVTDDDSSMGSGSANDKGTTDPTVIRPGVFHTSLNEVATQFPYAVHPTSDIISPSPDDSEDHVLNHDHEDQHPRNTNLNSHEKLKDSSQEHEEPGPEGNKYDGQEQLSPSSTFEVSRYGINHENSTQVQQVPGDFILWWQSEEHQGVHNTTSSKDSVLQDDHAEEVSTSEILTPAIPPGWDTNEIEEQYTSTTTVVSSSDVKHEDSNRDSMIHVVHSGWDNEVRYSANDTRDDTPPGTDPPGARDRYPTAVSSSDSFFKQEESTQYPLDGAHSGLETEDAFPTNLTSDDLHPRLVPSDEKENLKEEAFHTDSNQDQFPWGNDDKSSKNEHEQESSDTALTFHDGSKQEETSTDSHSLIHPSQDTEDTHQINNINDDVWDNLVLPSENETESSHKHITDELSNDVLKHEESTQNPYGMHPDSEWDSEEQYSTSTSSEETLPGIIPPKENEHRNTSIYSVAVILGDGGTHHEASTPPDLLMDGKHPDWNNDNQHHANNSGNNILPGIIPQDENQQEKELEHTVVISNDGTEHEVSTQEPLNHEGDLGWDSGEKHPANESTNNLVPGIIFPAEHVHEKETFHTAVIDNNDAYHEDATQEPLPPIQQPELDIEEEYSSNTSSDDTWMGINKNNGSKHNPLHTDVVSHDGTKDEDSTPGPVKHDSEDKYSADSTEGVLPPGIVPRRGTNKNSFVPDHLEDRGSQQGDSIPKSQPRAAHIPDWLIVVASLVALALILGVCIAVNSRRRCGQKQKLVINNGKGVVDNKNTGGLNGEASKSHEMVHLVHKEQPEDRTGPHDEFLQIDETNNLQDVDLKGGV
ncbi:CD44 antigen isoform X3 [Eublepharis macularius]|uniref:CD44 antigen n=1 Tax=Eublepharis macularius TaxID=481883 RepID=A0AA97KNG0_EUBMA|nr:CD44 antigen isoform X3 [Eublepharis macularius]